MADHLGPYELRSELGRGAMAVVWRAWDPNLEREVAIKEPVVPNGTDPGVAAELAGRFVREGKAAAKLNHPGIVTIYNADVYEGRPAIVMEVIEGETLSKVLGGGRLPPHAALAVLDQLLDAVGYAHVHGVVHRDIKPDNVFITDDGRVKLADFGIAHVGDSATLTQAGTVMGTPGYMSPEQVTGGQVGAQSDIFAIGAIAYELLTGANPFGASDGTLATTVMYRIVHEPARELDADIAAVLPPTFASVLSTALAKDPADRFIDAQSFRAALAGGPISTGLSELAAVAGSRRQRGAKGLLRAGWRVLGAPVLWIKAHGSAIGSRLSPRTRMVALIAGAALVLAAGAGLGWYEFVYMTPAAYAQRFIAAVVRGDTPAVMAELQPAAFSGPVGEASRRNDLEGYLKRLLPEDVANRKWVLTASGQAGKMAFASGAGSTDFLEFKRSGLGWKVQRTRYATGSERTESVPMGVSYADDARLPDGLEIETASGVNGTRRIQEQVTTENGVAGGKIEIGVSEFGESDRQILRGTGNLDNSMGIIDVLIGTRTTNSRVSNPTRTLSTSSKPRITLVLGGYSIAGDIMLLFVSPSGDIRESSIAHEKGGLLGTSWTWKWDDAAFDEPGEWYVVVDVDGRPATYTTVNVK